MVQKRKGINKPRHKKFLKEYNFEIIVVFLIGLGVFLLIEDLEIKGYLYKFIKGFFFGIGDIVQFFSHAITFLVRQFETSDLVGISLILTALLLIANRWRKRMIERYLILNNCPNCDGNLVRTKRNLKHKITSLVYFVDVKNYSCKNCDYNGIKLKKR